MQSQKSPLAIQRVSPATTAFLRGLGESRLDIALLFLTCKKSAPTMYYVNRHSPTLPHLWTALLLLCLALSILMSGSTARAEQVIHMVRAGDTLSEIALGNGVNVADLRRWNRLRGELIVVGQPLVVGERTADPIAPTVPTPAAEHVEEEVVEESETSPEPEAEEADEAPREERAEPDQSADEVTDEETAVSSPPEAVETPTESYAEEEARGYVVAEADTLGCIAARFDVTVEELASWNQGLDPNHIVVGQELAIRTEDDGEIEGEAAPPTPERRRRVHVVQRGETITEITQRYEMTLAEILRLNPELNPNQIDVDQRLVVEVTGPPSESLGSPSCGRLVNGRQLPSHPAYVVRNPSRSWATEETVAYIQEAFEAVLGEHPDAPRARVHDLSFRDGGPIDDHRSHQSGRDVDLTYYQRRCPATGCPLETVPPRRMALGIQWSLLEHWLRNEQVQVIFLDYGLQEVLYNFARRHGATRTELETWFQYPRGPGAHVGVIRHFRNHFDHLHVRFRCSEGDEHCR